MLIGLPGLLEIVNTWFLSRILHLILILITYYNNILLLMSLLMVI